MVVRTGLALAAVVAVAGAAAGCSDDTEPGAPDVATWSMPQAGFCDEVVAGSGLEGPVEETLSGDDGDTTATCTLVIGDSRVDLVVRVAEQAGEQYDQTLGELEDGFTGFEDAEVGEVEGWWTRGTRFAAVEDESVRLTDLLLDDTLVVRLQLVGTPAPGDPAERQAAAVATADALVAAIEGVLDPS